MGSPPRRPRISRRADMLDKLKKLRSTEDRSAPSPRPLNLRVAGRRRRGFRRRDRTAVLSAVRLLLCSIQTMSAWISFHHDEVEHIVSVWEQQFQQGTHTPPPPALNSGGAEVLALRHAPVDT